MKHLELFDQLKASNPHINDRWLPELQRLTAICHNEYKGNWTKMYQEYVNTAYDKKEHPRINEIKRDIGMLSTIADSFESKATLEKKLTPQGSYPADRALENNAYTATLMAVEAAENVHMPLDKYLIALKNSKPARGLQTKHHNDFAESVRQAIAFEMIFKAKFFTDDGRLYLKIQ